MRVKPLLPVIAILALVLVSGCINTAVLGGNRPEDVAKSMAQVQEFLRDYPDSELFINYRSEGYVRGTINEISDRCGPYFKIVDHWQIVFRDPATRKNLTLWLEKDTNQLSCLYGEGVGLPQAYIPGPPRSELVITGFSGLDINARSTEFYNGKLYLTIGNPGLERMILKRVTASYLDDVIPNITNSGLLSQGESFTYVFNLSRTISEGDAFWIDVDVLYDLPDSSTTNQRSTGSVIGGLDTGRILQCSTASFEVERYNFYIGTRVFSVTLVNTGNIDLQIKTLFREDDEFQEVGEPFTLQYGERKTLELEGLTILMESVVFLSEACPGAQQAIFIEDIAGV
jgi:hypothetical protein